MKKYYKTEASSGIVTAITASDYNDFDANANPYHWVFYTIDIG
jgi:hypothetical protein